MHGSKKVKLPTQLQKATKRAEICVTKGDVAAKMADYEDDDQVSGS